MPKCGGNHAVRLTVGAFNILSYHACTRKQEASIKDDDVLTRIVSIRDSYKIGSLRVYYFNMEAAVYTRIVPPTTGQGFVRVRLHLLLSS